MSQCLETCRIGSDQGRKKWKSILAQSKRVRELIFKGIVIYHETIFDEAVKNHALAALQIRIINVSMKCPHHCLNLLSIDSEACVSRYVT